MNIDKLAYIKRLEKLVKKYDPDYWRYGASSNWELQTQIADEIKVVIRKIGVDHGAKLFKYFCAPRGFTQDSLKKEHNK